MATPTYTAAKASAIANDTGGAWSHTTAAPSASGQLIIVHVFQDGTSASNAITIDSATNCTNLAGTSNAYTPLAATGFPVGSVGTPTGYHYIFFARSTGTSASVITGGNSGTDDIYVRTYQFTGVHPGTTIAHILENGTAGTVASDAGTSASVTDVGVTTTDVERLCLNFIAVADDAQAAQLTDFAGESGGTWAYPVAAAGLATGTDGTLALISAELASAGTINGASDAITSEAWGVIGFALRPTSAVLTQSGAVVNPITFGSVVNGVRIRLGQVVFPITFTAVTDGTASSAATSTTVARISLEPGSLPKNYANHTINVRARVTSGAGTIKAALYEGASNRSGDLSQALTTSLADYAIAIPEGSANDITSYANLEVRIWGESTSAVTFEVDQVSLGIPEAAQAGQVVSPITFGVTVRGILTARSAVALPITFGSVITGRLTAKSAVVSPFAFGSVISGRLDAKSAVAFPIACNSVVSANVTAFSRTAVPITFGVVANGTRTTASAVALPITFGVVTNGSIEGGSQDFFGAVISPFTFGRVVASTVDAHSSASAAFSLNRVVQAKVEAYAAVTQAYTLAITVFGRVTARSAITQSYTLTVGSVGRIAARAAVTEAYAFDRVIAAKVAAFSRVTQAYALSVFSSALVGARSAVALPITLTVTEVGKLDAKSRVSFPITFGVTTEGAQTGTVYGVVAAPHNFNVTSLAKVSAFSRVAQPYTFGLTISGFAVRFGRIALPITFSVVTSGSSAGEVFGSVVSPFTDTFTITGKVDARGSVVLPVTLSTTTNSLRTAVGISASQFVLNVLEVGKVDARGAVVFPVTLLITTAGGVQAIAAGFGQVAISDFVAFGMEVAVADFRLYPVTVADVPLSAVGIADHQEG
jgi:hypothetical protein